MDMKADIKQRVVDSDIAGVKETVQKALDSQMAASEILLDGLVPGIQEVGRLFEAQEYFLPEMMLSAEAMKQGVGVIQPFLGNTDIKSNGKVVIASVKGDVHDIGKNLVALMIRSAGFDLEDLGVDVPAEKIAATAKDTSADVVALSALLTTTMLEIPVVLEALKDAGIREQVKVLVGGAPVSREYAQECGADSYAPDAMAAPAVVKELIGR